MKNIHRRIVHAPIHALWELVTTLSSPDDKIWPKEQWPAIRLDRGLIPGSKGGHGPIGYFVEHIEDGDSIQFRFTKPNGFNGIHKLEIQRIGAHDSILIHSLLMKTSGIGMLKWIFAIKWLHDALIEDAFDKVQNQLSSTDQTTKWTWWAKVLRKILSSSR